MTTERALDLLKAGYLRHRKVVVKDSYTKKTTKLLLFNILRRNLSKFVTQMGLYRSKQLETTFSSIS